jgi:hypothetical protein
VISEILSVDGEARNSLHWVVLKMAPIAIVQRLLVLCPTSMLMKDVAGTTPLDLALQMDNDACATAMLRMISAARRIRVHALLFLAIRRPQNRAAACLQSVIRTFLIGSPVMGSTISNRPTDDYYRICINTRTSASTMAELEHEPQPECEEYQSSNPRGTFLKHFVRLEEPVIRVNTLHILKARNWAAVTIQSQWKRSKTATRVQVLQKEVSTRRRQNWVEQQAAESHVAVQEVEKTKRTKEIMRILNWNSATATKFATF